MVEQTENPGSYRLAFSLWVLSVGVRRPLQRRTSEMDMSLEKRQEKAGPVRQSTWLETSRRVLMTSLRALGWPTSTDEPDT